MRRGTAAAPGAPLLRRAVSRARAAVKRAGATPAAAAGLAACAGLALLLAACGAHVVLRALPDARAGLAFGGGEAAYAAAGREAVERRSAPRLVVGGGERRGVSLVAACRNRQETLRRTLGSWLRLKHVSELVIVDWGSEPPLREVVREVTENPRVRVVRVDGEREWVLSMAYNLAVGAATREDVIRADCDYEIDADFVRAHDLHAEKGVYYAGDYRAARDENEVHLNGAAFLRRADFLRVGGYDERIQTYGWDDTDLYARLSAAGGVRRNVSYDRVRHVQHGDSARTQSSVQFAQVEIDVNSLLLADMAPWSPEVAKGGDTRATEWEVRETAGSAYVSVVAARKPKSLRALAAAGVYDKQIALALGRRLHDDHGVPWDVIASMDVVNRRRVLAGVVEGGKKILFAHVMHGLGNRLRAMASAMAFARRAGRVLVLVWETDAHISASFGDLFKDDVPMITKWNPSWPFAGNEKWDAAWGGLHAVNYVEMDGHGATKDAFVVDRADKHMYFKSSCVMNTRDEYSNWERDNAELRALEPIDQVVLTVQDHLDRSRLSSRVGMHIRDRTLERDIKNVNFTSEYGNSASSTMDFWRQKSSHKTFEREIARLLADDPATEFYVASDTHEVVEYLARAFPGKVLSTPRDCDGRDSHCVKYALIDILALSKTRALYGSNWSSFTEAAQRFGGPKALLAGQDFGTGKPPRRA